MPASVAANLDHTERVSTFTFNLRVKVLPGMHFLHPKVSGRARRIGLPGGVSRFPSTNPVEPVRAGRFLRGLRSATGRDQRKTTAEVDETS